MAGIEAFVEGSRVIVRATFRVPDDAGALTDPTTITFTARRRGAAPTAYAYGVAAEVTRDSVGVFEYTDDLAEGTWTVHVQGTGAAHAAGDVSFVISRSEALA